VWRRTSTPPPRHRRTLTTTATRVHPTHTAHTNTNRLQASPLTLYAAPRVSVLHASFMEFLLATAHERYALLSSWPDFSTMFGQDYYYRCERLVVGALQNEAQLVGRARAYRGAAGVGQSVDVCALRCCRQRALRPSVFSMRFSQRVPTRCRGTC
jgi:hypothetical protein